MRKPFETETKLGPLLHRHVFQIWMVFSCFVWLTIQNPHVIVKHILIKEVDTC